MTDHPFVLWNQLLLDAFFKEGDEVWLQVTPSVLDSLGPHLGGDEGFVLTTRAGHPWARAGRAGFPSFVELSLELLSQHKRLVKRPTDYVNPGFVSDRYLAADAPPYLPYLAILVRAAVNPKEFYPTLRKSLKLPDSWYSSEMAKLRPVWKGLEDWTRSKKGAFGHFHFRTLGGLSQIGVPRSQTIISLRDSELMGIAFADARLVPGVSLTDRDLARVKACAATGLHLSSGFRDALQDPDYVDPIDARLAMLFEEWDGTLPTLTDGSTTDGADSPRGVEVRLCLTLATDDPIQWNVQWRIPAGRDEGTVSIEKDGKRWSAECTGSEEATTSGDMDPGIQQAARAFLAQSGSSAVDFALTAASESDELVSLGTATLSRTVLKTMVWVYDPVRGTDELRERTFPLNGPVYLLAPPSNRQRLEQYLQRERIQHETVPTAGLPQDWMMVLVLDAASVSEAQRASLPDGLKRRPAARAIRLVGGRYVNRAGMRQFLPYDLPTIELDAPAGTVLNSQGLELSEEPLGAHGGTIRRFQVALMSTSLGSFLLTAHHDGVRVAEARLRVSSSSGTDVSSGRDFAIDKFAKAVASSKGLSGILRLAPRDVPGTQPLGVDSRELGQVVGQSELAIALKSVELQFVDSLAQSGSIAFGVARDIILRLARGRGSDAPVVGTLLRLRSLGHLELETDQKGHLVRVHAVKPALYSLAITTGAGVIYGVVGTLRLEHWRRLANGDGRWMPFMCAHPERGHFGWRLHSREGVPVVVEDGAQPLEVRHHASMEVASWAPDREQVLDQLAVGLVESIGRVQERVRKLNPQKCRFAPVVGSIALDEGLSCQLFKAEDLDTRFHDVYSLGIVGRQGRRGGYTFVRDSRWGIWLAMRAFGDFVAARFGIHDASPLPIPYTEGDGCVWLPARMGLPAVLERALVLSSGQAAIVVNGSPAPGFLAHAHSGLSRPRVSTVFDDMKDGPWLVYRWVPRAIAELVASRLGAVLQPA